MGRKKKEANEKYVAISVSVHPTLYDQISTLAIKEERTISNFVSLQIEKFLNYLKENEKQ